MDDETTREDVKINQLAIQSSQNYFFARNFNHLPNLQTKKL